MIAELHHAWAWDCEHCGAENFCRSVVADFLTDEDRQSFADEMGVDCALLPSDYFCTKPETVLCKSCSSEYSTREGGQ